MNKRRIRKSCFSLSDQIFFAQRLSLLLNSGISIVEALNMMKNIDKSIYRKYVYEILIADIEKGIPLYKSIKNINIKFSHTLLTLIKYGEEGGHLVDALEQAYTYLDKNSELKKKIISSLIYPSFIIVATIIMTLFLILYIFPKIIPLFSSLDIKLPLITIIIQKIYFTIVSYGIWIILGLFISIITFRIVLKRYENIRLKSHTLILSIPMVSQYLKIYSMISVCSIGEMLLSSGKSLPDVITFCVDSSRNVVYKFAFRRIYEESMNGISFSNSLNKFNSIFPQTFIDMCAIGEKTGNLVLMFKHCGKIFEQDTDNVLKRFSSLIEPVLMVFMGLIVGSVALSIILPIYEITNHLSK